MGENIMGENIKILLIEDNTGDAYLIEEHLDEFANFSFELEISETLGEALRVLKNKSFDVIVLDLELSDSYGINTFLRVKNENPLIPIIILTGLNDEIIRTCAFKEGAYEFLLKGQIEGRLLECILHCSNDLKKKLISITDTCYFQ
jgi:two-component system, cell cycle sensor histidine kinase and response regulator CckA